MRNAELFMGLLLAVTVLAALARYVQIPYPLVGIVAGLGLGWIPGLPAPTLDPELIFLLFLPPLLYASAFLTSPAELRESAAAIGLLAVGLVVATLVVVAVVAHALLPLSWPVAFVLGAILSPTDPVAAVAILRRLGAPAAVSTVLEGEALVNDGTGLTAYKVALGAVGGTFAAAAAVGDFFLVAAGGIAVGLAAGELSVVVRKRIHEADLETAVSLLTPFAAYVPADRLGVSGVLAAVAAGVLVGARSVELSAPSTRLRTRAFWQVLTFVLESSLFLLVGLAVPEVLRRVDLGAGRLVLDVVLVALALLALRLAYVFAVRRGAPWRERLVQGACGIRGAVSVAAALALPLDVPDRDLVIAVTTGVVLATLAPPALGLGPLVARLGLTVPEARRRREAQARLSVVNAALACLGEIGERGGTPERVLSNLRDRYELRAEQIEQQLPDEDRQRISEKTPADGTMRALRLRLIDAQRGAIAELVRRREVDASLADRLEQELDLEASRLER